jgi:hypothetical protein
VRICKLKCEASVRLRSDDVDAWPYYVYDVQFECTWVQPDIVGIGETWIMYGAVTGAIKEFITKAAEADQLTAADFQC